jgi:GrpB-like predicted nucleotidyltransferase (UPF0157 family)
LIIPPDRDVFILSRSTALKKTAGQKFNILKRRLQFILPNAAEIHHVGATAIPACLGKGDLDICVRVTQQDFAKSEKALARSFRRNLKLYHSPDFAAFQADDNAMDIGIQLAVMGSDLDIFVKFAEAMKSEPSHVRNYNRLKTSFNKQSMHRYRQAKSKFIEHLLNIHTMPSPAAYEERSCTTGG